MTLKTKWTEHLKDNKLKEDFTNAIKSSTIIVRRLREILDDNERTLRHEQLNPSFDEPAWAYKQAYINGRLKEIERLRDLLGDIK